MDRQKLDDATIHTIIFSQENPPKDNSSIYHVFERLNTGGMTLTAQEIRHCINHGDFTNLLVTLTRTSIGGPSMDLKIADSRTRN
jgi:hypothetical protein